MSTCQPFVKELFWYYLQVDFLFNIWYWLSYCFYCFMISVCITVLSVKTNACCYLQRLYIWLRTKHVYLSYCNDYYFIAKKNYLEKWICLNPKIDNIFSHLQLMTFKISPKYLPLWLVNEISECLEMSCWVQPHNDNYSNIKANGHSSFP